MKEWNITMPLSDELLVAWLDGELSPETSQQVEKRIQEDPLVAERLALLDRASVDFAAAFAPMLEEAPVEALRETLRASSAPSSGVSRRSLLAATVAALAVGGVVGRFADRILPEDNDENWRNSVAQYMSLYTRDTLNESYLSAPELQKQLAFTNSKLGLHLSAQQLTIADSELKGIRLLGYERQSIAQILYLDRQTGPMALCITRAENAQATEPDSEVRYGMNVAYWRRQGFNYMLIGHKPPQALHQLARQIMAS